MTDLPDKLTVGEAYGPAMKIQDQAEATAYFEKLVQRRLRLFTEERPDAECVIRKDLGYYAGYYDAETRERVERLFACAHPVFGKIAEKGQPTAEQAFEMGKRMAEDPDA